MPREIPVTNKVLAVNSSVQEIGLPTGNSESLLSITSQVQKQVDFYRQKANERAYLQGQTTLVRELERINREHQNSPSSMVEAYTEYRENFLNEIDDPLMRAKFDLQIERSAQSAINHSTSRQRAMLDDDLQYKTHEALDVIKTELANTAVNLYHPDTSTAFAASQQMQETMSRATTILNQEASDGSPLVSASKRASIALGLRDSAYKTAALSWFDRQDNVLAASQDWLDGNVSIQMPDGKGEMVEINLRDTLPESSRKSIDNEIMRVTRDRITIQNQRLALQDRVEQQRAQSMFLQHQERLQNAAILGQEGQEQQGIQSLTLKELDSSKQSYIAGGMQDEWLAMRKVVVEGEPEIINGSMKQQLFDMAYKGVDPVQLGTLAVKNGQIDWATVQQAKQIFDSNTGPSGDIQSFYTSQLVRSLGGLNQELDITSQETISRAVIEFNSRVRDLQSEEQLTDQTAKRAFDEVLERNSNFSSIDRITARTPQFIPKSELTGRSTTEKLNNFKKKVIGHFMEKYDGDKDKIRSDPDYLEASRWIKDYEKTIRKDDINRIK